MACFLACAAEAVVATAVEKATREKEGAAKETNEVGVRITFHKKLTWLRNMLWGGAALLAFEHLWHGEVSPWFPFLTAMKDPSDTAEMIHEMSTIGVAMCLIVTAVWVAMVLVTNAMEKKVLQSHVAVQ
jgi:hypothetical protein